MIKTTPKELLIFTIVNIETVHYLDYISDIFIKYMYLNVYIEIHGGSNWRKCYRHCILFGMHWQLKDVLKKDSSRVSCVYLAVVMERLSWRGLVTWVIGATCVSHIYFPIQDEINQGNKEALVASEALDYTMVHISIQSNVLIKHK